MTQMTKEKTPSSKTFKLGTAHYNLSHSYGQWRLSKVTDGVLHKKDEITCKSDSGVFDYLAQAEMTSTLEARSAYERAN